MAAHSRSERSLVALAVLLTVGIFGADLAVPLGVAGGVPYVAVVLLTLWLPDRRLTWLAAGVASILTVAGLAWSPQGGILWVVLANRLLALMVIWLTAVLCAARKWSEQSLGQSEARYRELVENANSIILRLDTEGRITFFNEYAQRFFGFSEEEILGKHGVGTIIPETDNAGFDLRAKLGDLLEHPEDYASSENENVCRNGDRVWVRWTNRGIHDEEGAITELLCVGNDVTESKHAERERERLIAELESKNAELERFAYTVSHDLKSPLITIMGYAGILQEDMAAGRSDEVRTDIGRISGAAKKMEQLLNELLELSRIGRLVNPPREVSLGVLAHEAVELVRGQIEHRGVQVDVADDLPRAHADRPRLVEVLQNLIDNAVKYMGDQPHPRVEIDAYSTENETICRVRDNGIGIEPQYHRKIFELFGQLDRQSEGSGVGLALVKRIVEIHDGRIWVESGGEGKGATFCFSLPVETETATPIVVDSVPSSIASSP